ncbi:DUF4365 domain-containing protein [Methylomagnum ishizawai]|uniref:DUF4365 domain-containing protein n=1 Tax=Methylomagnum ishizawai TaxID=1760988 RepID=UPI001C320952|nr:DUF4365 domain-containing protein [Methylomagnum ishizawai]BBL74441.1 hypothetical protein MishRS11D_15390 [Methylomagnum ishizawai]
MKPLSANDIESELSYAYLHAVAAKAGVGCKVGSRHDDNAGIDAELTGWGPFPGGGYREEIDIKVQLKATVQPPTDHGDFWSYSLKGINRYNDLRTEAVSTPRLLVVLFLPADPADWLALDDDALILRKCAYWASLRGAKPSTNATAQTVYLPKGQRFDPDGLLALMTRLSRNDIPRYQEFAE